MSTFVIQESAAAPLQKPHRSARCVKGLAWLKPPEQARVRRANAIFNYALRRLRRRLETGGVCLIWGPWWSFRWQFDEVSDLLARSRSYCSYICYSCFDVTCSGQIGLLHNCKRLQEAIDCHGCKGHVNPSVHSHRVLREMPEKFVAEPDK